MFIRVIQGRATNPPGIRRDLGRWRRQLAADADGWLGTTAGITQDGWSITVVRFASEAQARRNSDRPEQREWWRDASQHLARVAVHDAPKVHLYGGVDEAGFVRVIQDHSDDLERMVSLGRGREEILARNAPQVLGVTVAEHADRPGDFTQIVYFTSEQDARRFAPEPPAEADEPVLEQLRSLMTNSRSFDLRDPQMLSPSHVPIYLGRTARRQRSHASGSGRRNRHERLADRPRGGRRAGAARAGAVDRAADRGAAAGAAADRDHADPVPGHHHPRQRQRRRFGGGLLPVVDATKAVVAIENVAAAINQLAQTTLRKVVGQHTLDQTLAEIGVDQNTTVVFPAPLMSTIQKLGAFLAREQAAGTTPAPAPTTPGTSPSPASPAATSTGSAGELPATDAGSTPTTTERPHRVHCRP